MMDKDFTRADNRYQQQRVWNKRLKQEFRWDWYECETWKDMKEHRYYNVFKTTGKPCSCYGCSGPHYKRLFYKFETDRIIREELYGDISHQTPRSSNNKLMDYDD